MPEGLWVRKEEDYESVYKVLSCFIDTFPNHFADEATRAQFAKKYFENGYVITCYLGEEPKGFIAGYANDHVENKTYVSLMAIDQKAGFMRGKILKMMGEKTYAYVKEQGMTSVWAEVYNSNTAANKLYRQVGMEYVKEASANSMYIKRDLP